MEVYRLSPYLWSIRLTQELNDKNDEMDEARLTMEDLDIVNKRLLKKLNSLPEKVKVSLRQLELCNLLLLIGTERSRLQLDGFKKYRDLEL